jgi:hypothetical protein
MSLGYTSRIIMKEIFNLSYIIDTLVKYIITIWARDLFLLKFR